MGKAETTGQTKAVTTEKIFGYDDYSHARSKDSVDPHEADVKPRAKGLHASVPWTQDCEHVYFQIRMLRPRG